MAKAMVQQTVARVVAAVLVLAVVVEGWCAPCSAGSVLAQGRPWRNSVPPAPNAPLTPCGCGFQKLTSRADLRDMPPANLRKMIASLEKEVGEKEAQLTASEGEHAAETAKLNDRLAAMKKKEEQQRDDLASEANERHDQHGQLKEQIGGVQGNLEDMNMELGNERDSLKELNEKVAVRMAALSTCDCKAPAAAGSLIARHTQKLGASEGPNYDLIFKVEDLERQRNKLDKQISKDLADFGTTQRTVLDRMDKLKVKMNLQASTERKYKDIDDATMDNLIHQAGAGARWVGNKEKQLERMKADVAAATEKFEELEAEMSRCGCAL